MGEPKAGMAAHRLAYDLGYKDGQLAMRQRAAWKLHAEALWRQRAGRADEGITKLADAIRALEPEEPK